MKKIKALITVCLGMCMLISNAVFAQESTCQQTSSCCGYTIWLTLLTLALVVIAVLLCKIYKNQKNVKSNTFTTEEKTIIAEPKAAVEQPQEEVRTQTQASAPVVAQNSTIGNEEYAAIAAAIYMYNNELHDEENTILTINRISKAYSPWSSKLYNMNTYFTKRR